MEIKANWQVYFTMTAKILAKRSFSNRELILQIETETAYTIYIVSFLRWSYLHHVYELTKIEPLGMFTQQLTD